MNFSIIIPTTDNREKFLNRSLEYYNKFECEIIIVDGSKKSKKIRNKKIKYYQLKKRNYLERLVYGLEKSKNNFTIICQDDDFLHIPNVHFDKFLKNKSFNSVIGFSLYLNMLF